MVAGEISGDDVNEFCMIFRVYDKWDELSRVKDRN